MARNRVVAVAKLELREVSPSGHYVLELTERRMGAVGRTVTIEDLGPPPVKEYAKDAWSTVLEELLTYFVTTVIELDQASMI